MSGPRHPGLGPRAAMAAAALLLAASCASVARPSALREEVEMALDPAEWVLREDAADEMASLRRYAPATEDGEAWTRLVTVESYAYGGIPFPGIAGTLRYERAGLVARCPGLRWTMLEQSERSALYEWRIADCAGVPDQHELGRVMAGQTVWARLSYSVQGSMDGAAREEWIRRLSAARFSRPRLAGPTAVPPPQASGGAMQ
ncbi:MAG TPA: hypothetical protein VFR37_18410 [Longimicrobium sp.]|nr:hypothetical protein [Longimicrobium sp.]